MKFLIFTVILLCLSISCFTLPTNSEFYDKVVTAYDSVYSYQADIEQINYFSKLKVTKKSFGKIYFQNGNIAIYYEKPDYQVITLNNDKILVYDKNSQTAVETRNTEYQNYNPLKLINLYWDKSGVKELTEKDNLYNLKLSKIKDDKIKEIILTLNSDNYLFQKVIIKNTDGNSLTQSFKNYMINRKIPEKYFKFKLPKNTKIINN